jgi:hypothetical protein
LHTTMVHCAVEPRCPATVPDGRLPGVVAPGCRAPGGAIAAAALAYDFGGDCGIYDVGTVEHARRCGLGTALTTAQLHDALARDRPSTVTVAVTRA